VNDYKQLILQNYTNIKNVHVYGGEKTSNAVGFGTVYVVPVAYSGYNISSAEQTDIQTFLTQRNVLGITPQIVQPTYLYLDVYSTIKYKIDKTTLSPADIRYAVANIITKYNSDKLDNFDTEFKLSDFMTAISNTDVSITSNETYVVMKKSISPNLNTPANMVVAFNNPIQPGSFLSSNFSSNGLAYSYTDYNPTSNTYTIAQTESGPVVVNNSNVIYLKSSSTTGQVYYATTGTINYKTGVICLAQITINSFLDADGIVFRASCTEENVTSYNNDIVTIDTINGINITVTPV
jgi:hypothetical protein